MYSENIYQQQQKYDLSNDLTYKPVIIFLLLVLETVQTEKDTRCYF